MVRDNWEDIKGKVETHYYWVNRDIEKDELIAKRRSAFCWLFEKEDAVISGINNGTNWTSIKSRLTTLLNFLEKLGCFILRKGTIEAYYRHTNKLTNDEKPNAASYEVNG